MERTFKRFALLPLLITGTFLPCPAQQPMDMSQEHSQHQHGAIPVVQPEYPRMGRAQEVAQGHLFTLEDAQRLAEQSNPTLRQAEAEIRAAKARQEQASLYPNPTVGYTADEIRGGSVGGGKQGFFAQQTVVTGGKIAKARDVYAKEIQLAQIEAEEQKIRVETSIRIAFYRVLAAQEFLDVRRDLSQLGLDYQQTQQDLQQTGQADDTEVLDRQIEAQRMQIAAYEQEQFLREQWRTLAAVIGQPDLPPATVAGNLDEGWPEINEAEIAATIATSSPASRIADAMISRQQAELVQARRQAIPDLQLRGGMEYNNELLGSVPQAKGWEGIAEVGVQLPIFNHNQGNIAASVAELDRAQLEKQRVRLMLHQRTASILDQYATSKTIAQQYRDSMLPRAKKAYGLMTEKYGLMLASRPRVLETERRLFNLQADYILTLEKLWTSGIALQGFLLTDGLEAPSRPGDMDRPVRETNLPMPDRMMSTSQIVNRP